MANETQFDRTKDAQGCEVYAAMLPEAIDGTLSAVEKVAFDRHIAGCAECAEELAEAQRGAAWLSLLKSRSPEPPAGLLERILAETSGVSVAQFEPAGVRAGETHKPSHGGWSQRWATARMKIGEAFRLDGLAGLMQPRFAMTAAMAFFSISLTLNLMGVRLHSLRAADFGPSGLRRTAADVSASASRRFENLRVVYQLESRVSELRQDDIRGDGR